jgi:hypothetical protein
MRKCAIVTNERSDEKHAADTTNHVRSTQPTAQMHYRIANHPATRHQNTRRTPETPEVRSKVTRRGGRSAAWEECMKITKEPTRNTQQIRQTMYLPPNPPRRCIIGWRITQRRATIIREHPETPEVRSKVTRRGGRSVAWEERAINTKTPTKHAADTTEICLGTHDNGPACMANHACMASFLPHVMPRAREYGVTHVCARARGACMCSSPDLQFR